MMKLYHGEHQRNLQKTSHVLLADTHVDIYESRNGLHPAKHRECQATRIEMPARMKFMHYAFCGV